MIGVITGDVINSRSQAPEIWLEKIKSTLRKNKVPSRKWEIFRGDMFQVEIDFNSVLKLAIELKASVKEEKDLDLRMAIGIGGINHSAKNVLESNGEAYVNSGHEFESLKKKNLRIRTPWIEFDKTWNMIFGLASLTMDNWAPMTAKIFKTALQNQDKPQKEIAKKMNKSSSTISEGLTRAGHEEIMGMIVEFNHELEGKISSK